MEVFIMVVQHNLSAMNANRMLGITQGTLSSSTEKLSSGYKVNRAADDAAGLSISEKMRKQIRGLTQASSNAEDGISAVQTAEGALSEVHDMLQRMNELATKAANGTNSEDDRQTIQDEISQLTTEIDRVAETTKFNETYLLKGDGTKGTKTLEAHDAGLAGTLKENANGKVTFTADTIKAGDTVTIGGTEYNIVGSKRTSDYADIKGFALNDKDTITQNGVTYTVSGAQADAGGSIAVKDSNGNAMTITVQEGAIHSTTVGKTTTLIGDAAGTLATKSTTAPTAPTWAAGDKLVDEDGVEYTYVDVSENAYLNDVKYTADGFYKSEGNTASDTAHKVVAGDTYTIKADGSTGSVANNGIVNVSDVQTAIKALSDGDTVKVRDSATATDVTYTVGITTKEDGSKMTADDIADLVKEGQYVDVNGDKYYTIPSASDSKNDISLQEAYKKMASALKTASSVGADTSASVLHKGNGVFEITKGTVEVDNGLSFNLHVGADADMTNKITVNLDTMSSAGLGVKGLNVVDSTGEAATYAIDAISDAIATVSAQRSLLGAVQNRLDHTINNLDNVVENTTSAESQIRDTDMATEMVKYSNANILSQAGQSMLAQANQSNQGVLSLLG
jgi:flagellin-like hook-associated protein FlgL